MRDYKGMRDMEGGEEKEVGLFATVSFFSFFHSCFLFTFPTPQSGVEALRDVAKKKKTILLTNRETK